jgi:hypothetical protein
MAIRGAKLSPFSSPALADTSAGSPEVGVPVSSFFGLCGVAGVLDVEFLSKTVSFFLLSSQRFP